MKFVLVLLCSLVYSSGFSQSSNMRRDFLTQNLSLEIRNLDNGKIPYIYLYKFDDGTFIDAFALPENFYFEFSTSHFGYKKLVVISSSSSYYILDIETNKLAGPFKPNYRRELDDAVSARIHSLNIIENGNYLTFNATGDNFRMDISDPSNPIEVLIVEIDNSWVRDEPYNGNVIMKLPIETECEIVSRGKKEVIRDEEDYWYKIRYKDKEGYIFGSQTSVKLKRQ